MLQHMTDTHVAFVSYGNDSIALLQILADKGATGYALMSDTGWAAPWWRDRVEAGEAFARKLGFTPVRLESEGLVRLVTRKKAWPRQGMQFCTEELKIKPAMHWLEEVDPKKEAICCVGVRREESRARQAFPEHTEDSPRHGGRLLWAPLVRHTKAERDVLVHRAGFDVLPHRSMECFPCVNSNRSDLRLLDEERVSMIERVEHDLGHTSEGKPRTMFRPYRHQGAVGVREVWRWARSERGEYEAPRGGCDSGFCETGDADEGDGA